MADRQTLDELRATGADLVEHGAYAKATRLYERLVTLEPTSGEAYFRLGSVLVARGRYRQGRDRLQQALGHSYDTPQLHLALGRALSGLKEYDRALREYERVPPSSDAVADALIAAGHIYQERQNIETAVARYKSAAATGRRLADAHLACATALEAQRPAEALVFLEQALELRPEQSDVHPVLARVLRALGTLPEHLQRIGAIVTRSPSATGLALWGRTLRELGHEPKAIDAMMGALDLAVQAASMASAAASVLEDVADLIEHAPDRPALIAKVNATIAAGGAPALLADWARVLAAKEWSEEATMQLLAALQADPKLVGSDSWCSLPLFTDSNGVLPPALVASIQSIVDATDSSDVGAMWAETLCWLGTESQGVAQFDYWAKRSESAELRLRWARTLATLEKPDEAREQLRRALELGSDDAQFAGEIGDVYGTLGDPASAVRQYARAALAAPADLDYVSRWANSVSDLDMEDASGRATREALRRYLDELPVPDAETRLALGSARARLGDFGPAVDEFMKAIDDNPALSDAYDAWAHALREMERSQTAGNVLATQLGGTSAITRAVSWTELSQARQRQQARAEELVRRIELDADAALPAGIYYQCRQVFNELGLYDAELRVCRVAAELLTGEDEKHGAIVACGNLLLTSTGGQREAIAYLQQARARKPDDLSIAVNLASAHADLGEYEAAVKILEEAVAGGVRDGADSSSRALCFRELARLLNELRRYPEAVEKANAAIALQPEDFWSRFRLAYVLSEAGRYDDAIAEYERAARLSDANAYLAYAHHNIAAIWGSQGRYARAMWRWSKAAEVYQTGLATAIGSYDSTYCMYYGVMRASELRQFEQAEELLRSAQALAPDNPSPAAALTWLYTEWAKEVRADGADSWRAPWRRPPGVTGSALAGPSQDDRTRLQWQATAFYRQALVMAERHPREVWSVSVLCDIADLHLLMDNADEAETAFRQVLERDPLSLRAQRGLGESYLRQKRYDLATRCFKKALDMAPDELSVSVLLGRSHLAAGELERAEAVCDQVVRIAPCHVDALAGLGEVYLGMAERAGETDSATRADYYDRAVRYFSKAIAVWSSDDKPTSAVVKQASVYYLRGYANVQLFNASGPLRNSKFLTQADSDFKESLRRDPENHKARRAAERLTIELRKFTPRKVIDRIGVGIVLLAALVFIGAQLGLLRRLPARGERLALTSQSLAAMSREGVQPAIIQRLRQLQGLQFHNTTELITHARTALDSATSRIADSTITQHAVEIPGIDLVHISTAEYIVLTFGALLFIVAGAYLPQLTGLKVAGLHLEKSSAETTETVRSIGISR